MDATPTKIARPLITTVTNLSLTFSSPTTVDKISNPLKIKINMALRTSAPEIMLNLIEQAAIKNSVALTSFSGLATGLFVVSGTIYDTKKRIPNIVAIIAEKFNI